MILEFNTSGEANLSKAENLPEIILSLGDSKTNMKVKQYECNVAHKTLGDYMSPPFDMKKQYNILLKMSTKYAIRLTTCSLSKYNTWIACFPVYIPQMTYTFPVSFYQHKQLNKL